MSLENVAPSSLGPVLPLSSIVNNYYLIHIVFSENIECEVWHFKWQ